VNLCAGCGQDFASVAAFDAHRVGRYPQIGPSEYQDRRVRGFVPLNEDWQPDYGRRCLDVSDLVQRGFVLDKRGRWVHPREARRERQQFARSERAPSAQDATLAAGATSTYPRAREAAGASGSPSNERRRREAA
jgi:hypothetical protein